MVPGGSSLDLLTCASTGSFLELLAGAGAHFWCCWRPWRLIWALLAAIWAPFGRSWRLLGQPEAPGEPQERPEARQEGPNRGQKRTQGAPGPPKRAPKEPPKALKNRSAQKYRKIRCFILQNRVFARFGCIFEAISSAKPVFFCFPRTKTPYFTRPEGAETAKNPKIHVFARRAVLQDVSRFWGGSGPRQITKNSVFTREVWQKTRKTRFFYMFGPPRP